VSTRRFAWAIAVSLLVLGALSLSASTALGRARPKPRAVSNFEIDGNQAGENDWQGFHDRGLVSHTEDAIAHGDDYFSAGQNNEEIPDGWNIVTGNVGDDANIADTYRALQHDTGQDAFMYLGLTRTHPGGTGSESFEFELNQDPRLWRNGNGAMIPCRTTGDLGIIINQHANDPPQFLAAVWRTAAGAEDPASGCARRGTWTQLQVGSDVIEGAVNTTSITRYLPSVLTTGGTLASGLFFEIAVNLTKLTSAAYGGCPTSTTFNSTWTHSKAAEFFGNNSSLKDYVPPQEFVVTPCSKVGPELTSTTDATATVGEPIFDTAHLSDAEEPTGKIEFTLYGPNDDNCSGSPAFGPVAVEVHGNGPYDSPTFTPVAPGTYRWRVTYSGDDNNAGVGPTACDIASETVTVDRAHPEMTTEASETTVLGGAIHDTATLTGAVRARGVIRFEAFAPADTTCATPVDTSTVRVRGNGTYRSVDFTPTQAGTWHWIATYSGDSRNHSIATGCGDPGEDVVVDPTTTPPTGSPSLTTTASHNVHAGSPISDTAHLTGGTNPTGTITFAVFGPDDANCSGPPAAAPVTVHVSGAGDYHSGEFTPTAAGTYRWVASYSGDAGNHGASTSCDDSAEAVIVSKAQPALTTTVVADTVPDGGGVGDVAHLTGGADPQGTITFHLYGPDDPQCSGPAAFVVPLEVHGNGSHHSPLPEPTIPGTYRWVAVYSGDANNESASTHCGDPHETVVVEEPPKGEIPEVKPEEPGEPSKPGEPPSEPAKPDEPDHVEPGGAVRPVHPVRPHLPLPNRRPPPPTVTG